MPISKSRSTSYIYLNISKYIVRLLWSRGFVTPQKEGQRFENQKPNPITPAHSIWSVKLRCNALLSKLSLFRTLPKAQSPKKSYLFFLFCFNFWRTLIGICILYYIQALFVFPWSGCSSFCELEGFSLSGSESNQIPCFAFEAMRKRERENPCGVCGHYHKYEEGEVCGVCGHRIPVSTEKTSIHVSAFPSEILPEFLYLGSYDNASRSELLKTQGISRVLNVRFLS